MARLKTTEQNMDYNFQLQSKTVELEFIDRIKESQRKQLIIQFSYLLKYLVTKECKEETY